MEKQFGDVPEQVHELKWANGPSTQKNRKDAHVAITFLKCGWTDTSWLEEVHVVCW